MAPPSVLQVRNREAAHLEGRTALLKDELVTALRKPLTATATLALLTALATGCTTPSGTPPESPTKSPTGTRSLPGENEEDQGKRAKAALETVSPDDPEFVESGLERVGDGVHSRSPLKKGKSYRVSVACVGTGTVKVVIAKEPPEPLPCDGAPAGRRIMNAPADLPIDIAATTGATGMIAWQIVTLPS